MYKPFYDGLRKGSRMSLMVNFISMFRRLCTFYPALFLYNKPWMQVIIFMFFSMFSLFYLMNTRPYKESKSNYVNTINEFFTLFVSYQVMIINGMSYDVKMFEEAGYLIERTLIFMLGFNGLILVYGILF